MANFAIVLCAVFLVCGAYGKGVPDQSGDLAGLIGDLKRTNEYLVSLNTRVYRDFTQGQANLRRGLNFDLAQEIQNYERTISSLRASVDADTSSCEATSGSELLTSGLESANSTIQCFEDLTVQAAAIYESFQTSSKSVTTFADELESEATACRQQSDSEACLSELSESANETVPEKLSEIGAASETGLSEMSTVTSALNQCGFNDAVDSFKSEIQDEIASFQNCIEAL